MPRYLVPADMAPGIDRPGLGFFLPGSIITLPDVASRPGDFPHLRLVPLEKEGHELLVQGAQAYIDALEVALERKLTEREKKEIRGRVKPVPGDEQAAVEAAAPKTTDGVMTVRQAAERQGAPGPAKSGRASDK